MRQEIRRWGEKPYHSLDHHLKETFGGRLVKLSLNGGMSCPNRDGTIGTGGCTFCSAGGSGEFAAPAALSVTEQLETARKAARTPADCRGYIAYFQAYTNTYAPVFYLRRIFTEAISHPEVKVLSVATRPDCLEEEKLALLGELARVKPVWVELGLQTMHERTAEHIRRGYRRPVFEAAVNRLQELGIDVIVHVILGLPGETPEDCYRTIEYVNSLPVKGIKLQLLHVLRGTDLAAEYEAGGFETLEMEEYLELLSGCIARLDPEIVIHRITGDGPKELLIAPLWSGNKKQVLNRIHHHLREKGIYQGINYGT